MILHNILILNLMCTNTIVHTIIFKPRYRLVSLKRGTSIFNTNIHLFSFIFFSSYGYFNFNMAVHFHAAWILLYKANRWQNRSGILLKTVCVIYLYLWLLLNSRAPRKYYELIIFLTWIRYIVCTEFKLNVCHGFSVWVTHLKAVSMLLDNWNSCLLIICR